MNPKNDLTQPGQSRPALSQTPRKRFRIEKLEERIAPTYKFNPKASKWVGGGSRSANF